ncbi:unnamed protein product [Effrenium voratum]|nr:unnamed protein product [Effrenium voratum]
MSPKKQTIQPKAKAGYTQEGQEEVPEQDAPVQMAADLIEEMLATEEALANLPSSSTATLEEMLDILKSRTLASFKLSKKVDEELKKRGKEVRAEVAKAKAKTRALAKRQENVDKRAGFISLVINFRNGSVNITVPKDSTIGDIRRAFIIAWNQRGGTHLPKKLTTKLNLFMDTDPLHETPRRKIYNAGLVDGSVLDVVLPEVATASATASTHAEEDSETENDEDIGEDDINEM